MQAKWTVGKQTINMREAEIPPNWSNPRRIAWGFSFRAQRNERGIGIVRSKP